MLDEKNSYNANAKFLASLADRLFEGEVKKNCTGDLKRTTSNSTYSLDELVSTYLHDYPEVLVPYILSENLFE